MTTQQYTIKDSSGNEIKEDITFDLNYFTKINSDKITFSGDLSLTTTNSRHAGSSQVNSIEILDKNNEILGKLDTRGTKFNHNNKKSIQFDFSDQFKGTDANKIKIDVGESDGIKIYKFDISACNTNISHVVPNNKRWVKNKNQTFTFGSSMSLKNCPNYNVQGVNNYVGDGSAYIIMDPIKPSYINDIKFNYSSNTVNFTYVIYGSDSMNYFTEIIYNGTVNTGSGTEDVSIQNYPKPFNYYKLVITTISEDNITLSDIQPTFEEFTFDTDGPLFREQHFEHFANKSTSNINEFVVPGFITLLFICVLSVRK
jgi:hypothetical protein